MNHGKAEDKYTHIGSSTANGAVVYTDSENGGQHLYSYHATDLAYRKQCDAFKLVQIHKFWSEEDEKVKEGTPYNKYPSFIKMCEFARAIPEVSKAYNRKLFGTTSINIVETGDEHWVDSLKTTSSGKLEKSSSNIMLILENDPRVNK